jgi:hypothetical protein
MSLFFAAYNAVLLVWTLIAIRVAWVMHQAAFLVVLSDARLNGYPLIERVWIIAGVRVVNAVFMLLVWALGVVALDWLFSSASAS